MSFFISKSLRLSVLIFFLLPMSFLSGCKPDSSSVNRITVYLSGPSAMLEKLEKGFEKKHGDVLNFVQMGCGPLRQRVWTEMLSGQIRADVFWGSDPLLYIALDKKGKLLKYTPAGVEKLKSVYLCSGNYTLVNERYGVVLYNRDKFMGENRPNSFRDLMKKRFRGKIVQGDPAQSSTALVLVAGLWDAAGKGGALYKGLHENRLFLAKKNSDVPSKIQEGEFDAGIAPHDEAWRLQEKAEKEAYPTPIAYAWPKEGALAIQRPIAISKNKSRSPEKEKIAKQFVDYMISKPAQEITSRFGFVSVRKDLPLPPGVPVSFKQIRTDWSILAGKQREIVESFKNIFK